MPNRITFDQKQFISKKLGYPALPQSNSSKQATLDVFDQSYGVVVAGELLLQQIQREQDSDDQDNSQKSATRHFLDDIIPSGVWKNVTWNGWTLLANGTPYKTCLQTLLRGCPHKNDHPNNQIFVYTVRKRCCRASCPKCYESWMNREANAMTLRLTTWMKKSHQNVSHVTVSLPESMHRWNDRKITKYLKKIYKRAGITGGYKILHPWRFDKQTGVPSLWVYLHLICYGWIINTAEIEKDTGIVIKKISTLYDEGNIFATCKYQLSHCAVWKNGHRHSAVPFDSISYSKLKIEKPDIESNLCPYCDRDVVPLRIDPYYDGEPPPFDTNFIGLTSFTGLISIEKYNQVYYDDTWNVVTTSKEMAQIKKEKNEKIRKINQKKHDKLAKKSKMCCTLEKYC